MPWCEPCAKYFVPSALSQSGTCPQCDTTPSAGLITARNLDLKALAESTGEQDHVPWHFKLLVVALVIYLSWRVVALFI